MISPDDNLSNLSGGPRCASKPVFVFDTFVLPRGPTAAHSPCPTLSDTTLTLNCLQEKFADSAAERDAIRAKRAAEGRPCRGAGFTGSVQASGVLLSLTG